MIRLFENGVEFEIIAEREGERGKRVGARGVGVVGVGGAIEEREL